MELDEFLDGVARRTALPKEGVGAAVDAVLSVLAEHLTPDTARHLRAQLPERLQEPLLSGGGQSFGREELVARVAERAGVDPVSARAAVDAVFDVLREAVDPGAYAHALAQLPPGYDRHDARLAHAAQHRAGARRWQPTAVTGEWRLSTDEGARAEVREVAGAYEARVWRRPTGPSPGPALELDHGPQVFADPEAALAYAEANLGAG